MPLIDYKCPSCGIQKEVLVGSTALPAEPVCTCGKSMNKQIGASNFILKGGGWYKDSYNSK